jgi:hypothetical protein
MKHRSTYCDNTAYNRLIGDNWQINFAFNKEHIFLCVLIRTKTSHHSILFPRQFNLLRILSIPSDLSPLLSWGYSFYEFCFLITRLSALFGGFNQKKSSAFAVLPLLALLGAALAFLAGGVATLPEA